MASLRVEPAIPLGKRRIQTMEHAPLLRGKRNPPKKNKKNKKNSKKHLVLSWKLLKLTPAIK